MRFQGLDLNLLVAFDVLMEERSVRRAAHRLNLSQPATSSALARLRRFFDDPLLVLEGRRMFATPYAESLLPHVRECLRVAGTVIAMSSGFDPAQSARVFRIAASDYIVTALMTPLVRRLSATAPNIGFEFIAPDAGSSNMLERGDIDLMIAPSQFNRDSCHARELFEERHVVIGCRENALLKGTLTEEQFLAAGHVAIAIGADRVPAFPDRQLALLNKTRRIETIAGSFAVVPWLLIGTDRLAMMPQRLVTEMARYLPIAQAQAPFVLPPMTEIAQYHRSKSGDEGLAWLLDEVAREAATYS